MTTIENAATPTVDAPAAAPQPSYLGRLKANVKNMSDESKKDVREVGKIAVGVGLGVIVANLLTS